MPHGKKYEIKKPPRRPPEKLDPKTAIHMEQIAKKPTEKTHKVPPVED